MTATSTTISELCHVQSGGTPSRSQGSYWGGTIPWVKISEMRDGRIRSTEEHISEAGLANSSAKIFPEGTVLLSIFATIGRTAVLDIPAATNQAIAGLTVKDESRLDSAYLRRYLDFVSPQLASQGRGAAQANINLSILKRTEIPLPTLAEQRRIAGILDKADGLRAKRRETIAKLDQLLQSLFSDLFGDPVTNDRAWRDDVKLGDVADIASGITKGRRASGSIRSVPYLAVANVQDRHLRLDSIKSIEATEAEIDRYRLLVNDLVLTEGGDPDKLGRGALWDGSVPDCIHQNHVFRVRVTSKDVDPIFLNWLVGSSRGKRYFLSVAKQTTGIASINMSQLKSFPLLIPPIDLQARFSAMVSAFEKRRFQFDESAKALDHLFESLQQRAFTGKL